MRGAVAGLGRVLRQLAPLHLMCDGGDLGLVTEARTPDKSPPTVYLYDNVPGGVGFSQRLYSLHEELLLAAFEAVDSCACDSGCPSCIGPVSEWGEGKQGVLQLLSTLLEGS